MPRALWASSKGIMNNHWHPATVQQLGNKNHSWIIIFINWSDCKSMHGIYWIAKLKLSYRYFPYQTSWTQIVHFLCHLAPVLYPENSHTVHQAMIMNKVWYGSTYLPLKLTLGIVFLADTNFVPFLFTTGREYSSITIRGMHVNTTTIIYMYTSHKSLLTLHVIGLTWNFNCAFLNAWDLCMRDIITLRFHF